MPIMREDSLNGHPTIEFDGQSLLQTRPFDESLPQPVTLILVAMAMGDTTLVDSLGSQCAAQYTSNHPSSTRPHTSESSGKSAICASARQAPLLELVACVRWKCMHAFFLSHCPH